jgi:son of sevenless-like protein
VQVPEATPDVPNRLESNTGRLFIVGHDFTPADIAMGPDGSLTGASLPALVEKLTPHDTSIVDPALLSMFFLTFRLFTTPVELFNVIVHRYRMEGPAGSAIQTPEYAAWMENKVQPVRIRIFSFLKLWLDSFWRTDVDAEVLPLLEEFASGTLQQTLPSVAPRLLHALRLKTFPSSPEQRTPSRIGSLLHKAKSTDRLRSGIPTRDGGVPDQILPPTPQIARSLFSALRNQTSAVAITDFDPLELARQLTVMESKLFLAVKSQDVLESYKRTTPALKTMSTFHGHLCFPFTIAYLPTQADPFVFWDFRTSLVQDTILTERDIKKRSAIVKFFIKLAVSPRQPLHLLCPASEL